MNVATHDKRVDGLQSKIMCWSLVLLLATCGCQGEAAAPPTVKATSANSPENSAERSSPVPAPSNAPTTTPTAVTGPDTPPSTASAEGTSEKASAAKVDDKPAPQAVAATPKWVKPRANPSTEQLEKWGVPPDPALQLLACYDFDDLFVQDMAVSPDGKRFVLAGTKLTLWTVGQSQPDVDLVAKYTDEADVERPLLSVGISPDGEWLAAGDKRGKLRVWKLTDLSEAYVIPAHDGRLTELAISPDSKSIATTSYSGEVRVWQLADGKKLKSLKVDKQEVAALAFLSETRLATAGREVQIWDIESGEKVTTVSTDRVANPILGMSRDRKSLLHTDGEGRTQAWDVENSKGMGPALGGAGVGLVEFSTDGKRIATYDSNATIRVWNAASRSVTQVIDADGDRTAAIQWLPESGALLVASETGRVRLWGTPETATALAITPPTPPKLRETGTAAKRSDTPALFQQVIDVRSFPRLPRAWPGYGYGGMESYTAPASQAEAELFYRHHLGAAGWLEADQPDPFVPGMNFQKDGYSLNVSFAPPSVAVEGREKDLQINLRFGGNYDARWLPRIEPVAAPGTFASPYFLMYRSKSDLMELEVALLKQLREACWTAFSRLTTSHAEEPTSRMLTLLQGGSVLNVNLGYPADSKSEVVVQASVNVVRKTLPLPPDAGWIEFDESTQLRFLANTQLSLRETIDFFDKEMALDGWQAREAGRVFDESKERAFLPYIREQQDVRLRLVALPDGRTRILAGEAEDTSWQVKNETAATAEKPAQEKPGIEAADFVLPKGATAVKFDVDDKQIEFDLADVVPQKLGDRFVKQMEDLGWARDGVGVISDDYVFITFKSGKAEIELRARGEGASSKVIVSGDGLLWTKPLPAPPVRVSYETWLRRGGKPATLELLDTFVEEMRQLPASVPDAK